MQEFQVVRTLICFHSLELLKKEKEIVSHPRTFTENWIYILHDIYKKYSRIYKKYSRINKKYSRYIYI